VNFVVWKKKVEKKETGGYYNWGSIGKLNNLKILDEIGTIGGGSRKMSGKMGGRVGKRK